MTVTQETEEAVAPGAAAAGAAAAGAAAPQAGHEEPEELLVEEISIDGMCGVY